jgi:hypothetical protein
MKGSNGREYSCYLPEIPQVFSKKKTENKATIEEIEKIINNEKDCFYRGKHLNIKIVNGWWTYELCLNKHIRQFHQEDGKLAVDIKLGNKTPLSKYEVHIAQDPKESYVSTSFYDGNFCELNKKLRETGNFCLIKIQRSEYYVLHNNTRKRT